MRTTKLDSKLDERKWSKAHTWTLITLILGLMLVSYVASLGSLSVAWFTPPKFLVSTLIAWGPIWASVGSLAGGYLADLFGRKRLLIITMALYAISFFGMVIAPVYYEYLAMFTLALFAAGAESSVLYAINNELFPRKSRGKASYFAIALSSIGAVISSWLATTFVSTTIQRYWVLGGALAVVLIIIFVRFLTPESIRWLESTNRMDKATEEFDRRFGTDRAAASNSGVGASSPLANRRTIVNRPLSMLLIFLILNAVDVLAYVLVVFTLGPYYFPKQTSMIILVSSLVAVIFGIIISVGGDYFSRRWFLFVGFLGSTILTVLAALTVNQWLSNFNIFLIILVLLNITIAVYTAALYVISGEVWPTHRRGTIAGIIIAGSSIIGVAGIYATANFTISQFIQLNIVAYAIGAIVSAIWLIGGHETSKGTRIEVVAHEEDYKKPYSVRDAFSLK